MAKVNTDCINRGYFSKKEAEVCQKSVGNEYEVKLELAAVRMGKIIYRVQLKPHAFNFFGTLATLFGRVLGSF